MTSVTDATHYDHVVVGAGTAGCVIASRLAERSGARVLLLEAGAREPLAAMADPPAWRGLLGSSADWDDETVFRREDGTLMHWARGRGLGGSSAINGMTFARGHQSSYDAWAAAGAHGWGFHDLLPAFKRSETAPTRDAALRGQDGPLRVGPAAEPHVLASAALQAVAEVGHDVVDDISGGVAEGFGWADLNIVSGRRQSAADAYLPPAAGRGPDVRTGAVVDRLVLRDGRCVGVGYRADGRRRTVSAEHGVVVCAGAVGSPLLLLRSGIGPAPQLRAAGIEVVADLPGVGTNLHDHPTSGVVYTAARPVPPASYNHAEMLGLVRTDPGPPGPDVQIMLVDVPLRAAGLPGPEPGQGYTIMVSGMTPRSRGSVRVRDAKPDTPPIIDPNYYDDPRDLEVMVAALRMARAIGAAPAMKPWRNSEFLPGPEAVTDAALRGYVRRSIRSYSHQGGTCRVGSDDGAVVDPRLRVRGVDGLFVADASVMPSPVSANTNATVYAIAERAAELITHGQGGGAGSALERQDVDRPA